MDDILNEYDINTQNTINHLKLNSFITPNQSELLKEIVKLRTELKQKDITICRADKNLGTVLINTSDYNDLVYLHLNDINTYKKVEPSSQFIQIGYTKLISILKKHKLYSNKDGTLSTISRSLLQLSNNKHLRIGAKFYLLIKMHKVPYLGRPIASSINTMTYHASKYLHNTLIPLVLKLPTICHNSTSFLLDVESRYFADNSFILCADVKSLYPSIPTEFGIKCVKTVLIDFIHLVPEDIDFICDLLTWVLTNNYIEFNEELYLQINGTAMGTPAAVVYAQIVLYFIERGFVGKNFYRRYIDDIFAIFSSISAAETFIQQFQSLCPSIKLESITIEKTGIFLDMKLALVNNHIISDLYQKPINKYQYLPPFSNHSSKLLHSIIVQEIRRIRLLCSTDTSFEEKLALYKHRLIARGYKNDQINNLFNNPPSRKSIIDTLSSKNRLKINKYKSARPLLIIKLPNLKTRINFSELFKLPDPIINLPIFKRCYKNPKIMVVNKNLSTVDRIINKPSKEIKKLMLNHKDNSIYETFELMDNPF